ncbi:Adenylate cyclase type 10 [Phlyctochytrium bullatum]|nr:Adenylate cyclase type 10 [Phlyctochytrium bullatum]
MPTDTEAVSPLSLLPERLRGDLGTAGLPGFPHLEIDSSGVAVIVDISGYTRLTNQLASTDTVDRIRDILNPPFELILGSVQAWGGSVIKLAGDSALAVWSSRDATSRCSTEEVPPACGIPHQSEASLSSPPVGFIAWEHLHLAMACAVGILEAFRGYKVELKTGQEILNVHIGIGCGEMWHVFVGSERRAEYLVTGPAVADAGKALDVGKSGQMVILERALEAVAAGEDPMLAALVNSFRRGESTLTLDVELPSLAQAKKVLKHLLERAKKNIDDGWGRSSFGTNDLATLTSGSYKDATRGSGRNAVMADGRKESDSVVPLTSLRRPTAMKSLSPRQFAFLEPSLAKYAARSRCFSLSDYQQYRTITVLFVHMSSPSPSSGGSSALLVDLQFLAETLFMAAAKNGGTCRQINFDDKGVSGLLVWGIEGFAHEKGDPPYAAAAASSLRDVFSKRLWMRKDIEIEMAVTCGKATGVARENRNDPMYMYEQILASVYAQLIQRGINAETLRSALSERPQSTIVVLHPVNENFPARNSSQVSVGSTGASTVTTLQKLSHTIDPKITRPTHPSMLEIDEKVEFFHAFGLSIQIMLLSLVLTRVQLKQAFPSLLGSKEKEYKAPSGKEDLKRLCGAIAVILNSISKLGLKLILFLDDIQWMDPESWNITLELVDCKPFVIMTSRLKAEYGPELSPRFDQLSSLPAVEVLNLEKLSRPAVESLILSDVKAAYPWVRSIHPKLVEDLCEKSQGTPMVLRLLVKLVVSSDPRLGTPNAAGMFGSQMVDWGMPNDGAGAVVAQLDRFSTEVKNVLRVASVAGQFFCIAELQWVLSKIYPQMPDLAAASTLSRILHEAMQGGLITAHPLPEPLNPDDTFSFGHYLLYHGIYQSLLSARREEIHGLYADYYERALNDSAAGVAAQRLIALTHHLLKTPGQVERKVKVVRRTFLSFAEWQRPAEGIAYYRKLEELRKEKPSTEPPIEKAKELRLLGEILLEDG